MYVCICVNKRHMCMCFFSISKRLMVTARRTFICYCLIRFFRKTNCAGARVIDNIDVLYVPNNIPRYAVLHVHVALSFPGMATISYFLR